MHHLQLLDELVSRACCFTTNTPGAAHAASFNALLDNARNEAANVRAALLEEAFSRKAKKELKLLVQTYQAICIDISNKMFLAAGSMQDLPYNNITIDAMLQKHQQIQQHLLSLLSFLDDRFTEFFNPAQSMPLVHAISIASSLHDRMLTIKERLAIINDDALLQFMISPIQHFILRQTTAAGTYYDYACLKRYLACLELNFDQEVKNPAERFVETCISINVVPLGFLDYYLEKSRAIIAGENVGSRQIIEWQKLVLRIKQMPAYNPVDDESTTSVKSLIIAALNQEVDFLEKGNIVQPEQNLMQAPAVLQTPMSVSQLALFIRVMVDSGTIKCSNHSAMLRMIAGSVQTGKAVPISSESLRVKYYTTDPAAISILKDYIIKMMNQLRTY
jgi:hypothetical protein